eukprot:353395-Chlamydomonas_euryale.AAC.3
MTGLRTELSGVGAELSDAQAQLSDIQAQLSAALEGKTAAEAEALQLHGQLEGVRGGEDVGCGCGCGGHSVVEKSLLQSQWLVKAMGGCGVLREREGGVGGSNSLCGKGEPTGHTPQRDNSRFGQAEATGYTPRGSEPPFRP